MRMQAVAVFAVAAAGAAIEHKQVTVGGLSCGSGQTASVYYPTDNSKKYPLLAFAHGITEGGSKVAVLYKDVLETTAGAGYVVIALQSCPSAGTMWSEAADQLKCIDYIKSTPKFSDRVDPTAKVALYGHSMGGGATGYNAANKRTVSKYNIGAAVLLHPEPVPSFSTAVPAFFASGSRDTIVPPGSVKTVYGRGASPKIYAEIAGATHFECQSEYPAGVKCPSCHHRWTPYVIDWMDCYLKKRASACTAAFGVCHAGPKMTQCVTKGGGPPAPPGPPPPPAAPKYHCDTATSQCVQAAEGHSSMEKCLAACAPAPTPPAPALYSCQGAQCIPDAAGVDIAVCQAACG